MIKFKNKQSNNGTISNHVEVNTVIKSQSNNRSTPGIYGVDCCRCGVKGYCNADLYLHRGDICPEYIYDDGRAKDPDDF